MKHYFRLCFICLLLLSTPLYSGDVDRLGMPILIYENGFTPLGSSFWGSGGAGLANPNNAEVLFYNPGWPAQTKQLVLTGGLKQFEKRFSQIQDLEVKIGDQWLLPSYLLVGHRFTFGFLFLGIQNVYNFKKKLKFEVKTVEFPDGTGEFLTNVEEQTLQNFFIGFNRPLFSRFSFGIKMGLLRHLLNGEFGHRKLDSEASYSFAFSAGIHYKVSEQVHLALNYRYFDPLTYTFKLEGVQFVPNPDSVEYVIAETELPFRLPWFLGIGFHVRPFNTLQFVLKLEYQEWAKISKYYTNRLQLALGAIFTPNERWQLRLGAFTSGDFPEKNSGLEDTPFLTAGLDYWFTKSLKISLSALTNSVFVKKLNSSTKQIERSQILFGMQWAF